MEQEFYITQKAAMIGSWDWDIKKGCIYFSETALNILGLSKEQSTLTNAEFFSLIYKPDRKKHLAVLKASTDLQTPYKVEIRCNLNRPHKRWLDSRGEMFFDDQNQPYRMIGMHQDITHVVVQRQLQEEMKKILQNIVEHEQLGQILTKVCTVVEEVESSIYCAIYLYSEKSQKLELHHSKSIPDTLKHILNSITIEDKSSELIQTLVQSETLHINNINELPTWQSANQVLNTTKITSYCGQPLLSSNHNTEGALCLYLQDAQIPKVLLNQILDIASRIAAVAIEGQHQSDNQRKTLQQLYHSQKMDSIGHLTAGIAHDFNNILGSIVGYNSLAKKISDKQENEKLSKFLNEVSVAATRARDLISQMMIFSRTEPSKNIPVDTRPVIKEVLQLIKSMIPSSITIHHHFEKNIKHISINPIALHQVIMNLLINAKDAAEDNVGKIAINLYQQKLNQCNCTSCHDFFSGDYVCIEIKDAGTGIPKKLIGHIFDPFFTTKDIGRGTGMGLSVVHGIIHDCGGHLSVTSRPEPETSFKLYFPALETEANSELSNQLVVDEHLCIGNGEHIMVVDDDIPLSLLFEEILSSYGYEVTRFDNSQVALEAFLNNPTKFQLILSDQTMPFLTGDEMVKQMISVKPELPVIICTGYSEKLNQELANKIGIKKILTKPVAIDQLLDEINIILNTTS